jgi:hypothetical protein
MQATCSSKHHVMHNLTEDTKQAAGKFVQATVHAVHNLTINISPMQGTAPCQTKPLHSFP